ncbi:phosphoglycerate mutase [Syntrophus gentianae]|uniref:Phosphoglycerate mutase n=1 Tax=Syntrophus gentianae TaxID=43775 RepID=A0A1H7UDV8_9BACT|nr:2,3-bisphosphoglycerate-independent phosphoglycerate mutase [Syntrophus gentianae]SEL95009.1 phosphoglycerate mutase [Syntrophus gentianae]
MSSQWMDKLVIPSQAKMVFLIMDGLGGLPMEGKPGTELETAITPHLDALARGGVCGLLDPIAPGITPGSGPAHFALFGYDPVDNNVGRGLLSAAGLDFPMTERDLFMRVNFATVDSEGRVTDRRAGRIDTETNERLCRKLAEGIRPASGTEVFFATEKEHRALIVLRGDNLREEIAETDPQKTGLPPLSPKALIPEAAGTANQLTDLLNQARTVLADEPKANMMLLRGYSRYHRFEPMSERFGLSPLAIASYPMYRGISRLLGMTVHAPTSTLEEEIAALETAWPDYDFFFVHVKPTDSRGEDGDFDAKVKAIETVDALIPRITALSPDVLVVTGDHSTPAALASHSWHPVPVVLSAKTCRPDRAERFGEGDCLFGGLGRMSMSSLMTVALAHAGRLTKFGA